MSPLEEQEVLGRCRKGDPQAWERFFEAYYEPLGRYVFQVIPDATPEDVEEVCQDAFLAAVRSIAGFQGRSQPFTWLCRIAGNKARDFRDRRLAAKRGGGRVPVSLNADGPGGVPAPDPVSPDRAPDQSLASAEEMAGVRRALDGLGDPCREMLELRYFADLEYAELARMLELNPKTVSSRLSRCLDKLGEALTPVAERQPVVPRRALA